MTPLEILIFLLVTAWLSACAVCDIRTRQVPNRLTVPPLILAALWLIVTERWLLAILVAGLVLVSELPEQYGRRRVLLGGVLSFLLAAFLPSVEAVFQAIALYTIWALWELGLTGAADAKLLMALVGLFSAPVFCAVLFAGGLQGLWWKLAKKDGPMPYAVAIAAGTLCWLAAK